MRTLVASEESQLEGIDACADADRAIVSPLDAGQGIRGILLELPLERVALFVWSKELGLADVTALRKALLRAQARRALLFIPAGLAISSAVLLLATLSRIALIREVTHDHLIHDVVLS
ncbi:hypothetical protein [Candidatus Nitrospira bockiana]